MKKILYLYIATLLLAVPSVVAQVDGALTRSGEVGAYNGTRADFLTVAGKLSRYPRLSKSGEALHYAPIVSTDSVPQVAGSHDAVTVYGNVLFNGWYDELTEQGFQICTNPDFTGSTLASYPVTPVNAYVECDQPCAANLFSTVSAWDIVIGSFATLLACLITWRMGKAALKKTWVCALVPLPTILCNAVIVGAEIAVFYDDRAFLPAWGLNALSVGAGEAAVMYAIGLPLLLWLRSNKRLSHQLQNV